MAQKNIDVNDDVLARFVRFCKARGLNQGDTATNALHTYMQMDAESRDKAALSCRAWINDPQAIRDEEAADAVGRAARVGASEVPVQRRAQKPRKTG